MCGQAVQPMRWWHWGSNPGPRMPKLSCCSLQAQARLLCPCPSGITRESRVPSQENVPAHAQEKYSPGQEAEAALPWLSVNLTVILLGTRTSGATLSTSSGPSTSSHCPGLARLPFQKALGATERALDLEM